MRFHQLPQFFLGITILLLITTQCTAQKTRVPKQFPGCAKDIGVGEDGAAWAIGCTRFEAGNFDIYYWNGSKWENFAGIATRIAVEPNGTPWVVNTSGQIFKRSENLWQQLPGCAKDIGVGENGAAWMIGCKPSGAGNFPIYYWNGSKWNVFPGAATRIAVEPGGTPWIAKADGKISKRSGNSWQQLPGCAKDIGVGKNGAAWILSCTPGEAGGFEMFSWNGSKWNAFPGFATHIAVEPNGTPWVITVEEKIFRL